MFRQKLKERNCRRRKCRKAFAPRTKWHEYCSTACATAEAYVRRCEMLRRAQKIIEEYDAKKEAAANG